MRNNSYKKIYAVCCPSTDFFPPPDFIYLRINGTTGDMKSLLITPSVLLALLAPLYAGADFDKGLDAVEAGDFATAEKEGKKAAAQGNADAQFNLALMYRKGESVLQDDKETGKWYLLAAEQR